MNTKVESGETRMDGLKWIVVIALVFGGAYANYHFGSQPMLYRVLGMIVIGAIAAFVAVNTAKGQAFWTLVKEAQIEVRKVVWPTTTETNQTTALVGVVVIIAALFLWVVDWLIGQVARLVLGG